MIYRAPDVVALNLNLSQEIGKTMVNNYENICYKFVEAYTIEI